MNNLTLNNVELYKKAALMSWVERDNVAKHYIAANKDNLDIDKVNGLFAVSSHMKMDFIIISVGKSIFKKMTASGLSILKKMNLDFSNIIDPDTIDVSLDEEDMIAVIDNNLAKLNDRIPRKMSSVYYKITMKMLGQMLKVNLSSISSVLADRIDDDTIKVLTRDHDNQTEQVQLLENVENIPPENDEARNDDRSYEIVESSVMGNGTDDIKVHNISENDMTNEETHGNDTPEKMESFDNRKVTTLVEEEGVAINDDDDDNDTTAAGRESPLGHAAWSITDNKTEWISDVFSPQNQRKMAMGVKTSQVLDDVKNSDSADPVTIQESTITGDQVKPNAKRRKRKIESSELDMLSKIKIKNKNNHDQTTQHHMQQSSMSEPVFKNLL